VTITSQAGENFGGQLTGVMVGITGEIGTPVTIFLSGTVDAAGALQGTYEWGPIEVPPGVFSATGTFNGQFDSSSTPKTLGLSLSGTLTFTAFGASVDCAEEIAVTTTLLTAGGQSADLSISGSGSPTPVATGNRITFNLTIHNAGPNDAADVLVVNPAPLGTSNVAATTSQGQCVTAPGSASCALGTIPNGATATVAVTAEVFAPAGSTLVDSPNVSSSTFDPNLSNNTATIDTPVVGGALVKLTWNQPAPTAANPTPAPSGLGIQAAGPLEPASSASAQISPMDSCTLTGVNVYASGQPNVQPMPANLVSTLAADAIEATVPVPPSGSSYIVTNVWKCGTTPTESGTSNEVDIPAGPTITALKVTGKLRILGSGFNGPVKVFVDGVGFIKSAGLSSSAQIVQKGPLTDGSSISDIGTGKSVLITVENGDGGFATFTFERP
jgi:uncharacterized repeat protein (TIGR01451 family)